MTSHQSSEDLLQPGHIVKVISFVTFCALLLPAWPSCFIQFPHTFFYAFILSSNLLYFCYVTTYFLLFFLLSFYFPLLLSVSFCFHLFPPDSSFSSFFLLFFMFPHAFSCLHLFPSSFCFLSFASFSPAFICFFLPYPPSFSRCFYVHFRLLLLVQLPSVSSSSFPCP